MNQQYQKSTPSPNRYSSRKPIFQLSNQTNINYQNGDLYRIVAKIRQLEDDVRILVDENKQIQGDNKFIKEAIVDLEYTSTFQEDQIIRLTQMISNEQVTEKDPIGKYQEELALLSRKVDLLNQDISERHRKFDQIKTQKEQAKIRLLQAKEQWNSFQFEQNQLNQKIDELLGNVVTKKVDMKMPPDQKILIILEQCKQIQIEISNKTRELNMYKQQAEKQFNAQRQKRIQQEYSIELLRQRNQDYEKKKNFFKNCYNQQSIAGVIDDMLEKEHILRSEISHQIEMIQSVDEQMSQALKNCDTRVAKQRSMLLEEIKVQRLQNDLLSAKRDKATNDLHSLEQAIYQLQDQGVQISIENRVTDNENFTKISQLEKQNIQLERQYSELLRHIDMSRSELQM